MMTFENENELELIVMGGDEGSKGEPAPRYIRYGDSQQEAEAYVNAYPFIGARLIHIDDRFDAGHFTNADGKIFYNDNFDKYFYPNDTALYDERIQADIWGDHGGLLLTFDNDTLFYVEYWETDDLIMWVPKDTDDHRLRAYGHMNLSRFFHEIIGSVLTHIKVIPNREHFEGEVASFNDYITRYGSLQLVFDSGYELRVDNHFVDLGLRLTDKNGNVPTRSYWYTASCVETKELLISGADVESITEELEEMKFPKEAINDIRKRIASFNDLQLHRLWTLILTNRNNFSGEDLEKALSFLEKYPEEDSREEETEKRLSSLAASRISLPDIDEEYILSHFPTIRKLQYLLAWLWEAETPVTITNLMKQQEAIDSLLPKRDRY